MEERRSTIHSGAALLTVGPNQLRKQQTKFNPHITEGMDTTGRNHYRSSSGEQ
jgi:hypothetical protein